jgi:hypothetical protein
MDLGRLSMIKPLWPMALAALLTHMAVKSIPVTGACLTG